MAGHNKWSQIKHKKAKEDAKRGKAFTKLIKEISVATRAGGGNPDNNAHLRTLLEKAKNINMPQENVIKAIKRGTGELPGVNYEEFTYEGFGPNGIAIIVETLSDNKNRTVAELRRLFSSKGGNLREGGSVNWMFEKIGVIRGTTQQVTEDELLEQLLAFDVKDLQHDGSLFSVFCGPRSLEIIKEAVQKTNLRVESAQLEWIAKTTTALDDKNSNTALEFLSTLQDHDDVKNVYTNLA